MFGRACVNIQCMIMPMYLSLEHGSVTKERCTKWYVYNGLYLLIAGFVISSITDGPLLPRVHSNVEL